MCVCKNKQHYFTLELTETASTCITSPAEGIRVYFIPIFTCTKTEESHLKTAILGGDADL